VSGTPVKEHVVTSHTPEIQLNVERESAAADAVAKPPRPSRRRWVVTAVAVAAVAAGGWYVHHHRRPMREASGALGNGTHGGKATLGFTDAGAGVGVTKEPIARADTVRVELVPRSDLLRLTGSLAADERSSVASNRRRTE